MNLISTIKSFFNYFTLYAGGGGGAPAQQNVTTTSIPEYARPYVEKSLGQAAALTDISQNPYQSYSGQRISAFTPLQAQAMQSVSGMQVAPQLADASNLAYTAGQQGLEAFNRSGQLQNTALGYGQAGSGYGAAASQFGSEGALAAQQAAQRAQGQAGLYGALGMGYGTQGVGIGGIGVDQAQQGFGAGSQYAGMATSPGAVSQYMSPYMQNAVDVQKQEAIRDYQKTMPMLGAQAARSGAFGGSRQAITEAEAQRNVNQQLANIQATGSQQAYDKAMQSMQFGSNLGLQGLQAGYQGLQTGLQGTAQGMQGAGLGLQGVGQQIAGGQLGLQGAQTGIQGQQAGMQGAQTGLQGVQTATGAGQYGLQGAGAATSAAGTLGQLGQTQFGQQAAITDAQMRAGALQQAQEQKGQDMEYQSYLESLNYPYKQLGFMSDLYRGLPLSQSSQSMYQNPSAISQAAGLGTAAYGLYQMGKKNGGSIREGDGLDTLGLYNAMRKQG
jgi:hypothetical protein